MKLLLDTHLLLWALLDDPHLSPNARRLIADCKNKIYYSVISPWEVQIKHQAYPDELAVDAKTFAAFCDDAGYLPLPVKLAHVFALASLKQKAGAIPHKDPFDRMLICQASVEGMILLTHDKRLAKYDDPCVMRI